MIPYTLYNTRFQSDSPLRIIIRKSMIKTIY